MKIRLRCPKCYAEFCAEKLEQCPSCAINRAVKKAIGFSDCPRGLPKRLHDEGFYTDGMLQVKKGKVRYACVEISVLKNLKDVFYPMTKEDFNKLIQNIVES